MEGPLGFEEAGTSREMWRCPACTFDNPIDVLACDVCGSERPYDYEFDEGFDDSDVFDFDSASPDEIIIQNRNVPKQKFSLKPANPDSKPVPKLELNRNLDEKDGLEEKKKKEISQESFSSFGKETKTRSTYLPKREDKGSFRGEGSSGGVQELKDDISKKLNLTTELKDTSKKKSLPLDSYKPEPWMVDARGRGENEKESLNLIVVGHVDAGKSTLMGHLLHRLGNVSKKEMHKNEKEAKEKGKGSFAYAWVLDEGVEERARGVTISVAMTHLDTPRYHIVLLDSPGHQDFVPSMISGASQADAAILAIDSTPGAFMAGMEGERGMKGGGQTREHAQLARSLGVEQLIVAVNKLDMVDFSEEVYQEIKSQLSPFLKHCGFRDSNVTWLPVSGLDGENLIERSTKKELISWYTGPSLIEAIDSLRTPPRILDKPLRIPVAEVIKSRSLGQAAISGKLEGGGLKAGTKVLILPSGNTATIKSLEKNGTAVSVALAGETVDVGFQGGDSSTSLPLSLFSGAVICHPDYPVPIVKRFECRILTLGISTPILKGTQVVLHAHCVQESACVSELVALLDSKTGTITKKKVRVVTANQSVLVEIAVDRAICLEEYSDYRALGRVTLRDRGRTLAVGIVTRILS